MTSESPPRSERDRTSTEPTSRAELEALAVAKDPILRQMLEEERIEAQAVDTALFARLMGYVRPHWRLASVAISMAIFEAMLMTLPAYVVGLAMDRVMRTAPRRSNLLERLLDDLGGALVGHAATGASAWIVYFGLVAAAVWILRWAVAALTTYLVQKLGQLVVHDLRCGVYNHITGMDLGFFHTNPVGRLVNRTTFDIRQLSQLFTDAVAQGLRDFIFILVLIAVMLGLDIPLALILVGSLPILVLISLGYRRFARPALRTNSAVQSRMNAWLAENLSGMRENHLYRREQRRLAEFESLTQAHQASISHVIRAWSFLRPAMLFTSALATAGVLLVGYNRVAAGLTSVGILLTFLQYTTRLWRPVRNLVEKFNLIQTSLTAGERVVDILDRPSGMTDLEPSDSDTPDSAARVRRGGITFNDVWFRYNDEGDDVLRGVSFDVKPGQMLALVGDTGAGKSTIAHLISRFYDADRGEVRVDGMPVGRYRLEALRSGIAIVPQDVVVFAGSVRENIALGADVDPSRLRECVEAVRASSFIDRYSDGLDHILEEGGRTLSTGERQLLSFARALVVGPPILILDEATANVDTQTELRVQEALEQLTEGRTSVVIAHRLSTIRKADKILVLRHGEIVERGTHQELLALGGEYARLYQSHVGESGGT